MLKRVLGLVLGFGIGLLCHLFSISLPAPTALKGALLVMTITLGYLAASWWVARKGGLRSG
ncbi:MAG: XapX domain-containing protein [Bradymonadales bacterium]|nr:MAG: XapX domain-containing protein [Bradymonadales bacterium]